MCVCVCDGDGDRDRERLSFGESIDPIHTPTYMYLVGGERKDGDMARCFLVLVALASHPTAYPPTHRYKHTHKTKIIYIYLVGGEGEDGDGEVLVLVALAAQVRPLERALRQQLHAVGERHAAACGALAACLGWGLCVCVEIDLVFICGYVYEMRSIICTYLYVSKPLSCVPA